jgi:stalled ribosome rescue protein Dom34
MTYHAAVWLDHVEARIYAIGPEQYERSTLKSEADRHQHHHAGATGSGHADHNEAFYHKVAEALAAAHEVYVCGPGTARTAFVKHVEHHDPKIAARIVKAEAADHPTDGQVVAAARRFFKAFDRTTPQT